MMEHSPSHGKSHDSPLSEGAKRGDEGIAPYSGGRFERVTDPPPVLKLFTVYPYFG